MRVTQSMLNRQMLQSLTASNNQMQKYQDMLSTGKRLNKPSDDPVGVSFTMRYKAQLGRNDQYLRNLDAARSNLEMTETAISNVNDIMQRVNELAVQGASDTTPGFAKTSIAAEVDQLKEELLKLGNTNFNSKYIFNGQKTDEAPYPETVANKANTAITAVSVSDGVNIQTNVLGKEVFGGIGDPDELFQVMQDLSDRLKANDSAGVGQIVSRIKSRMDATQVTWADVGARLNRLDLIENRLKDAGDNLTKLRTQIEDADEAEVITNLKMAENVQRASLASGARILQPSLVDFLR